MEKASNMEKVTPPIEPLVCVCVWGVSESGEERQRVSALVQHVQHVQSSGPSPALHDLLP